MKFADSPPLIGCVNQGKHVITAWGDNVSDATYPMAEAPTQISVTDSDKSTGDTHAVETYNYDPFDDRWSIDYEAKHPYFVNIVTLSPGEDPCSEPTYTASSTITIRNLGADDASALHYQAGVRDSFRICTYDSTVTVNGSPIADDKPQVVLVHPSSNGPWSGPSKHHYLLWDWEFNAGDDLIVGDGEVPPGTSVTITTTFTLPQNNTIYHDDVKFGYGAVPVYGPPIPGFEWAIVTPGWSSTGSEGYVIGSYELFESAASATPIVRGYLQHEYSADQNPDLHYVRLSSFWHTAGPYLANLKFGYTTGPLTKAQLDGFLDWRQYYDGPTVFPHPSCAFTTILDGRLSQPLDLLEDCPIPTVTAWGALVLCLCVLIAGTLVLRRRTTT